MKRNVTMIDELPELEDDKDMHTPTIRGIRPNMTQHQMQQRSMLSPERHSVVRMTPPMMDDEIMPSRQREIAPMERPPIGFIPDIRNKFDYEQKKIHCIEVAEHINSCPICSRFYNVDKTPYILAVVILSIVCIILLKRVLSI
jgi:hypothetical protein